MRGDWGAWLYSKLGDLLLLAGFPILSCLPLVLDFGWLAFELFWAGLGECFHYVVECEEMSASLRPFSTTFHMIPFPYLSLHYNPSMCIDLPFNWVVIDEDWDKVRNHVRRVSRVLISGPSLVARVEWDTYPLNTWEFERFPHIRGIFLVSIVMWLIKVVVGYFSFWLSFNLGNSLLLVFITFWVHIFHLACFLLLMLACASYYDYFWWTMLVSLLEDKLKFGLGELMCCLRAHISFLVLSILIHFPWFILHFCSILRLVCFC